MLDFKPMLTVFLLEYSGAAYYRYSYGTTEILGALWI